MGALRGLLLLSSHAHASSLETELRAARRNAAFESFFVSSYKQATPAFPSPPFSFFKNALYLKSHARPVSSSAALRWLLAAG